MVSLAVSPPLPASFAGFCVTTAASKVRIFERLVTTARPCWEEWREGRDKTSSPLQVSN